MSATLGILHEALNYTANFARPTFELWGDGGKIVRELYDALAPYNVTLANFQIANQTTTAADVVVSVRIGQGSLRFSFDKIEVSFVGFSEQDFQKIPSVLEASTAWIRNAITNFQFASHRFVYSAHFSLKDKTTDDFLRGLSPKQIKSAGFALGTGTIFNCTVPDKKWTTQLIFDRSQHFPGALFISLSVNNENGIIDYQSMLMEGRAYFAAALGELGLQLPETAD